MFHKRNARWFEAVGLGLLLISFGWQCMEERASQIKTEGILLETNEKLIAIWAGVYDEALHSDRYHGESITSVNYDSFNQRIKDWEQIQRELSVINIQEALFFRIRVILFIMGSVLIIQSKIPQKEIH